MMRSNAQRQRRAGAMPAKKNHAGRRVRCALRLGGFTTPGITSSDNLSDRAMEKNLDHLHPLALLHPIA